MPTRSFSLGLLAAVAALLAANGGRPPRAVGRAAERLPVSFWSWQAHTPTPNGVRRAIEETGATDLFLRVGQFEWDGRSVSRIRTVEGPLPSIVRIRLVMNATPALLDAFETIDVDTLAASVAVSVRKDLARAAADGATVVGAQLDFDVPTRLLPRYEALLRATRRSLPDELDLSVTGLTTWMSSPDLLGVLDAVDFWIPQLYGTDVARGVDDVAPIATPSAAERAVRRAEGLGKPYLAGLAAYGTVGHYDARGRLVELRGDLDPAWIAGLVNLERIAHAEAPRARGEWRDVYAARAECAVDGMWIAENDRIVVDVPTSSALCEVVRSVRNAAGPNLRGLCIFRLPDATDPSNLTIEEVRAAIDGRDAMPAADVRATGREGSVAVEATNAGTGGPLPSRDAVTMDVAVAAGSIAAVETDAPATVECLASWNGIFVPCSPRRASLVRVHAPSWRPASSLRAVVRLSSSAPAFVDVVIVSSAERGSAWRAVQTIGVGAP